MSRVVKFGEQQTIDIMSNSVNGITLTLYAQADTVNVPFSANLLNLTAVQVKCTLYRGNRSFTIFNDNLRNLYARSVYGSQVWKAFSTGDSSDVAYTLVAAGVAAKQQVVLPIYIVLPGIINLKGSDKLITEVNLPSSAAGAGVDTSVSNILFDYMEGVGVEWAIPQINSQVIQANVSSFQQSLGSFVTSAWLFNFDKRSYLESDRVVSSMQLSSDKWQRVDEANELLTKASIQGYMPVGYDFYQSFLLYSGKELNNVNLSLNLNTNNVNASQNWIIWDSFQTDPAVVKRAISMQRRHDAENVKILKGG